MKKLLAISLILVTLLCSCSAPAKKENGGSQSDDKYDKTDDSVTGENEKKIEYWCSGRDEIYKEELPENVCKMTGDHRPPGGYCAYNHGYFEAPYYMSGYYENKDAPKTKELTVNGATYTLEYDYSYDRKWVNSCVTEDVYVSKKVNIVATFHSKSGKLTDLFHGSVKTKGDLEQLNKDVAIGMCVDAARNIYGESIFEKDGFKLTRADFYDYGYENPYYVIAFTREINGYMTAEKITIRINTSGWIDGIFAYGIGMFDRVTELPSEEEMDKAYTLLLSCISDEYLKTLKPPCVSVSNTGTVYLSVESSVKRDGISLKANINIEKY